MKWDEVMSDKNCRGRVLDEAKHVITEERQDMYGHPENCFNLIAGLWNWWLYGRGLLDPSRSEDLQETDVAMMMTLLKVAREAKGFKRDNIVDACGYLGIYADLVRGVELEKAFDPSPSNPTPEKPMTRQEFRDMLLKRWNSKTGVADSEEK